MSSILHQSERIKEICKELSEHKFAGFLLSHQAFAFFYGIFLFGYEISLIRNIVSVIHPIFIAWGCLLICYDVFIRKSWEVVVLQKILFLFGIVVMITGVINYRAGIVGNIKECILTVLPVFVLYPTCFLEKAEKRRTFLISFSGAAVVTFVSSLVSVFLFFIRFQETITFLGQELEVGLVECLGEGGVTYVILNGIYVDSGHAATFAMSSVVYSCILFWACKRKIFEKKIWNRIAIIFCVFNISVQLCYFTLANSRGGWLSFFTAVFASVFLYTFFCCSWNRNRKCRGIVAICIATIAIGLSWFFLIHLRNTISQVSFAIEEWREEEPDIEESDIPLTEREQTDKLSADPESVSEKEPVQKPEKTVEQKETPANISKQDSSEQNIPKQNTQNQNIQKQDTQDQNTPNQNIQKQDIQDQNIPNQNAQNQNIPDQNMQDQDQEENETDSFERPRESGDSIGSGRLGIWKEAVSLYLKRPVFGECPGNNAYYASKYDIGEQLRDGKAIHNSYLDLLVDYGLAGFLLLMCFYVRCAWKVLIKLVKDGENCNSPLSFAIGGIVMTMCASFFLSCSFVNTTAMYFTNLIFMSYLMAESFLPDPIPTVMRSYGLCSKCKVMDGIVTQIKQKVRRTIEK